MYYPIAIEWGDENTATSIVIPDIPGAMTAGDNYEEAYRQIVEAAHIMLEDIASKCGEVPMPTAMDRHRHDPEYAGWGWGMVEIDVTPYLGKTEKINVTLPGNLVRQIDGYVQKHGLKSRSSFLAEAALDKVTGRA